MIFLLLTTNFIKIMKSINSSLIIIALLFVCNTGFSQSDKTMSKAIEKTDKLDSQLKSENLAFALSESQREQIIALQVERMNEISAYRKSNSNKEEVKAKTKELGKAMNAKIKTDILTPEQVKAYKAARKKMKTSKGKGAAKASAGKKAKSPAATITVAEADEIYATTNAKQKARAEKSTEKLNAKLIASDASLALSADQIKEINALNIKGLLERAKMEKEGATKEEVKKIVKSNKRAIKSILTKEQKNAQKKKKSE